MQRQVITIGPDGTVSGLQRKPGQGLDLRQFGKAEIKRASLIEWDSERQRWFVDVLQEQGKGKLTLTRFRQSPREVSTLTAAARLDQLAPSGWGTDPEGVLLFTEYDQAVKVEIDFLDMLRIAGLHPAREG